MKSKRTDEIIIEEEIKSEDNDPIVPQVNINVPVEQPKDDLVSDKELLDTFSEITDNLREDRKQTDDFINKFADMVLNEGDASNSSKEALVNLLKIKSDLADKMAKIADLKTRIRLKERDTFPRYLAVNQTNTITTNGRSRAMLDEINKRNKDNDES